MSDARVVSAGYVSWHFWDTSHFFDPSGNRLETFGGYTAYQMDPDCRAIRWTQDQIGPAVFYYSQELNETFLSVYT